jgi:hypothetical protein
MLAPKSIGSIVVVALLKYEIIPMGGKHIAPPKVQTKKENCQCGDNENG